MNKKITIDSLSDLRIWAESFSHNIRFQDVFLLYGTLGVGKTQLVSYFVEALQKKTNNLYKKNTLPSVLQKKESNSVTSPTFSLHQVYPLCEGDIHHFDFYRLKNLEEVEGIGFWDVCNSKKKSCVFVEWADRLGEHIQFPYWTVHKIHITILSNGAREIKISNV